MWSIAVIVAMVALTGFYAAYDKQGIAATEQAKADMLAESMALYREAVVSYFTANPAQFGSVPIGTLKSSNALPVWSRLYQNPETSTWANFRDADGMIYVYASPLPPANIIPEIVRLSRNSVYAGVYRTGDTTLYSPVLGNTGVKLPSGSVTIPNGSPVWIAMRR